MKKIMIAVLIAFAFVATSGIAAATTADFYWDGSGLINAKLTNTYSSSELIGGGDSIAGEFHADDDNYDRVEVTHSTATFTNGGYAFTQYNDMQGSKQSNLGFSVYSDTGGFINFKTDEWRNGNCLKTNGYNGFPWSWPGTDEPAFGAVGNYNIQFGASSDQDGDDVYESSYSTTATGSGSLGFGTWKAGSNSILSAGGQVSGDVLGYGTGSGSITQDFNSVGSFTSEFHWS